MGKIEVKVLPHAEYKGKVIVRIGDWYKVTGQRKLHKTLTSATNSI